MLLCKFQQDRSAPSATTITVSNSPSISNKCNVQSNEGTPHAQCTCRAGTSRGKSNPETD